MRTRLTLILLIAMAVIAPARAASPGALGRWLTASGNVEVTIGPCGPRLCGFVSRVFANNSMESGGVSKAPPPKIGMRILSDVRLDGDGWTGRIFDRENGRTYDCQMTLQSADRLAVRAYIVLPVFGKTQIWRRMPG
jgi:uncharacterized protein (DUF2147 family)